MYGSSRTFYGEGDKLVIYQKRKVIYHAALLTANITVPDRSVIAARSMGVMPVSAKTHVYSSQKSGESIDAANRSY